MGTSMNNSQIRTWGLCVLGGIRPEMRWEAEDVLVLGMGRGANYPSFLFLHVTLH